jgi:hypothetical protein
MRNLIDDPKYAQAKIDLRHRLFESLRSNQGRHVVPFTERRSEGAVHRHRDGPGAAPFPSHWLRAPNEPNRMLGIIPDTVEKLEAQRTGKPFTPNRGPPPATAPLQRD